MPTTSTTKMKLVKMHLTVSLVSVFTYEPTSRWSAETRWLDSCGIRIVRSLLLLARDVLCSSVVAIVVLSFSVRNSVICMVMILLLNYYTLYFADIWYIVAVQEVILQWHYRKWFYDTIHSNYTISITIFEINSVDSHDIRFFFPKI